MTPKTAGEVMRRARILLRAGELTPHQFCLLDCLMWRCRPPGSDRCTVSLRRIADLTRRAKDTVVAAMARFEALGIVRKVKRRVLVAWGGAVASRQATNTYVFLTPSTESTAATVYREQEKIQMLRSIPAPSADVAAARAALAAIARRRTAALAGIRAV